MRLKIPLFCLFLCTFQTTYSLASQTSTHKKQAFHVVKKHKRSYRRRPDTEILGNRLTELKTVYTQARPIYPTSMDNLFHFSRDEQITFRDPRKSVDNSSVALNTPFSQLRWPEIAPKIFLKEGRYFAYHEGYLLKLTLDAHLQEAAAKYLDQNRVISGATVIVEAQTGRILALAQSGGIHNAQVSVVSKAPAASLIKIITASSSIEKELMNPEDEIRFRGGCGYLHNENWIVDPRRDQQTLSFEKAFGSSCNTVFGRLAIYKSGLSSLKYYAEKFMFNRPIPSDIHIQTSLFLLPDPASANPQEVAEAGAGFGATKLSPIHAALLSSTIGNEGVMMAPYLVDAAYNSAGKEVYKGKPVAIGKVVSRTTAQRVERLMMATISKGTGRRIFSRRGTRGNIDDIAGKTGTLLDPENRELLYTWFSGMTLYHTPNTTAIGTVVASQHNWVIRASSVAQNTLAEELKLDRQGNRFVTTVN